jgi:hypothetical protein
MEVRERMANGRWRIVWLCALCALCGSSIASAQSDELTLYVRRNFGYGGGSRIQGSFRMEVEGPADLAAVTFKVDEAVVATVTAPPFRVDFETGDYGLGWHDLTATAITRDGRTLTSNTRRFEFVSAEEGWRVGGQIAGMVFGGVAVIFVFVMALQLFIARRAGPVPLGARRNYGWLGGAVCPKCGRPFPLHIWSLNAVGGKFDRCDHCGKWSLVRRATPQALAAAEAAEVAPGGASIPITQPSPEERLRKQLDDTRFTDE